MNGNSARELGDNLRELRRRAGWSQYQLEAACGISQARISLIENGWRRPKGDEVTRLAEIFGVANDEIAPAVDEAPLE